MRFINLLRKIFLQVDFSAFLICCKEMNFPSKVKTIACSVSARVGTAADLPTGIPKFPISFTVTSQVSGAYFRKRTSIIEIYVKK